MQVDSELVLVLAPTENDSTVAAQVLLDSQVHALPCQDVQELCCEMEKGCAVIVIAEEALATQNISPLNAILKSQDTWSDVPVILLTAAGAPKISESFSASGNIAILERPFSKLTLVRAVDVALRARKKQYQVKELLHQQKMAAQKRDDFFATLSHELRTPLNVILGWIEIFKSGDLTAEARAEALSVLERNASVQKALIDDLLDISRIITGKLYFQAEPVSMKKLLDSVRKSFLPRAIEKNLRFEISLPADDCMVLADEQRMSQVLTNLLTNAIKFTPEGGFVRIGLTLEKKQIVVRIKDSGQGIEESFLPFVFDRLKQEDMSTTRSHGGLGLGLAITSHIVELHQGQIEAKSEGRGRGAEFILRIPSLKSNAEVKINSQQLPLPSVSLDGVRILVVDDSLDILQLINLWLRKANAQVQLASSAAEALKEIPRFKPDIVLSDIGMPTMDGYELIKRIKTLPGGNVIKAVALTAYAKDEERTRAIEAGFQMHISKPISRDQLISAVSTLISLN